MRCIEMLDEKEKYYIKLWLTLTWDVLKYLKGRCGVKSAPWLTLTWDVLKYKNIF